MAMVRDDRAGHDRGSPAATGRDARWTVTVDDDRSAALLIRVWLESGTEFRARLTTIDTSGDAGPDGQATLAVASSTREVLDGVSRWLDAFPEA
jgi:hypothetical protein